jgi:hypothetical protein
MNAKPIVIPTKNLSLADVPGVEAPIGKIFEFALMFDPRELKDQGLSLGNLDDLSDESSLPELRGHLYFEQRRWNHYGQLPDSKSEAQLRRIVSMVREKLVLSSR